MGEWENKYYELVGHKEVLIQKLNDGIFAPPEWEQLMDEMKAHNMHAMANDLKKRYDEYKAKWVDQPVETIGETMIVDELTREYVKCNVDTDEVEYSETCEMTKEEVRYRNSELRQAQSRWRWIESALVDFDQLSEVSA